MSNFCKTSKGIICKKPNYDWCYLCGTYGKMTREHIPAKCSGNHHDIIEENKFKSNYGYYRPVLCEFCNGLTSPYAKQYGLASIQGYKYIDNVISYNLSITDMSLQLHNIKPLEFIKSLLLLFITTSNDENLRYKHPEIINFIMTPDYNYISEKYIVHLNMYNGNHMSTTGVASYVDYSNHNQYIFSEFRHPPFDILIGINNTPIKNKLGEMKDILSLLKIYRFGQKTNIINLPIWYVVPNESQIILENGKKIILPANYT